MSETPRRQRPKGWSRFVTGEPYPSFCWAKPFARVFERTQPKQPGYIGLAIAAVGEHDGDVTHASFGRVAPVLVVHALTHVVTGKLGPNKTGNEEFSDAYDALTQSTTGAVDIVVVKLHEDPSRHVAAHLGSRETATLMAPLDSLTTRLMEDAGVTLLPTLSTTMEGGAAAL